MTSRFKWLIPILILSLLVMSVLPSVSCTEGQILYLLLWSVKCGIEVYLDGDYQGTLEFAKDWGACVLPTVATVGMYELGFTVPGSVLAASASDRGIQLRADQTTAIPNMKVTYEGVLAPESRCEINLYYPPELITESPMRLSGESENQPPLMGSIVVETSSEPFEPRLLINPSISCAPSGFTVMLQPDAACSATMMIGNQGDAGLTYHLYDVHEMVSSEVSYDNQNYETSACYDYAGTKSAIKFTPPSYPIALKTARLCLPISIDVVDHEQLAVEVYDDDGIAGEPGTMLGRVHYTPTGLGWSDVDLSSLGITIDDGEFYVAYCQLKGYQEGGAFGLGIDSSPPHSRSWRWTLEDGVWAWRCDTSSNYMIRCVLDVLEDCSWLDLNPKSGSVDPGGFDDTTIAIDASGLAPAEYNVQIVIFSNDPDKTPMTVPVALHVIAPNNPPNSPSNPSPADNATDVHISANLSWAGGDSDAGDTVTYDVYFGTTSPPPLVSNDQLAATYDPGTLKGKTKYYWRVVATDNHGASTSGAVWDFTSGPGPDVTPHFFVDKLEVAVGGTVTFDPTPTYGGSLPYTRIKWDFDGDGFWDKDLFGIWASATLPIATRSYDAEGKYHPCLEITDSSTPIPVVRKECMFDPYAIVVGDGITKITWNLPYALDADPSAVNIWTYPEDAVIVTLADVDTTMPDGLLIWYYGGAGLGWRFYKKGWGTVNTLETLTPGKGYIAIVPSESVWEIPQG